MPRPPAVHEYVVANVGVSENTTDPNVFAISQDGVALIQGREALGWEVTNLLVDLGGVPVAAGRPLAAFFRREL